MFFRKGMFNQFRVLRDRSIDESLFDSEQKNSCNIIIIPTIFFSGIDLKMTHERNCILDYVYLWLERKVVS